MEKSTFNKIRIMNNRINEVECVARFLKNKKLRFQNEDIVLNPKKDDVVDVFFRAQKFQVIRTPFEFHAVEGQLMKGQETIRENVRGQIRHISGIKSYWIDITYSAQKAFYKIIVEPIIKKAKYNKSSKGIILLLDCGIPVPPWLETQIKLAKKLSLNLNFLRKIGFDEIYLVCFQKNISIYP